MELMRLLAMLTSLMLLAVPALAQGDGHDHGQSAESIPADDQAADVDDHGDGVMGPEMLTNDTWSHTFTSPGTFEYHCHPHPWMQGTIKVLPSDGSAPREHVIEIVEPADFEAWTFTPEKFTVRAGDTVTWLNPGAQMHRIAETTGEHAEHIASAGGTVEDAGLASAAHIDGDGHSHGGFFLPSPILWITLGLLGGVMASRVWDRNFRARAASAAAAVEVPSASEAVGGSPTLAKGDPGHGRSQKKKRLR